MSNPVMDNARVGGGMNDEIALSMVNKIFQAVFHRDCPCDLETLREKWAFDVKLPVKVSDSTTGEETWTSAVNATGYITDTNSVRHGDEKGWMLEKRPIHDLSELVELWKRVNLTTTERIYDSVNVTKSDTIYRCENVYQSGDCSDGKNLIYCDSCPNGEYLLASQRSGGCNFCIRTDDSGDCSNSYVVVCSKKISNSMFIQDAFNLHECMFCSHMASKKYCIANMQYEPEEYFAIKRAVVDWILASLG